MDALNPATLRARIRIQIEYIEMPDMRLTPSQLGRLCNLPSDTCHAAVAQLVASGFLSRASDGSFVRRGLGHESATAGVQRSLRIAS